MLSRPTLMYLIPILSSTSLLIASASAIATESDKVSVVGVISEVSDLSLPNGETLGASLYADTVACQDSNQNDSDDFFDCISDTIKQYKRDDLITGKQKSKLKDALKVAERADLDPTNLASIASVDILGENTIVLNRITKHKKKENNELLLSDQIASDTTRCASKHADDDDKFFRCMRSSVKHLKSKKSISSQEKQILNAAIDAAQSGGTNPESPTTEFVIIDVRVTDPSGAAVIFASVSPADGGASLGMTDVDGFMTLSSIETPSSAMLRFSAEGYADQVVPLEVAASADSASLEVTMIARNEVRISIDEVTNMAKANIAGAGVTWADGAFQTASGDLIYNDSINLTITPVDVSNPATLAAFPGTFTGDDGIAGIQTIASLGTAEYTFSMQNLDGTREELQLAQGATATIQLPLYFTKRPDDGSEVKVDDELPLWSLNEQTGVWVGEGMGRIVLSGSSPTGLAMEADVSHFSWWNIDVPMETGDVTISLESGVAGTATVTAQTTDIASSPRGGVISAGSSVTVQVPAGVLYCYSGVIRFDGGQTGSTNEVCTSVASGGSATVALTALGLDAPLEVTANATAIVSGFVNTPIQRVKLRPLSFEDGVIYSATGLPAGLTLVQVSDTTSELVGVPTESGLFNVVVTASNSDLESDSISIAYDISGGSAPTQELSVVINGSFEENTAYLNELVSVPANSWALLNPDTLPTGMEFDAVQSEIYIPYNLLFNNEPEFWTWSGIVTGNFDGGVSVDYQVSIRVDCNFCGFAPQ